MSRLHKIKAAAAGASVSLLLLSAIPATAATRFKCTGDAAHSTPPIVNYPTHVRNIVWRNTRAICQQPLKENDRAMTPNNSQLQEMPKHSQ